MMMASPRDPSIKQQMAASKLQLDDLNLQGDKARAEVSRMRADLAELNLAVGAAEQRLEGFDAERLREANRHLVLSSLRAQTDAEDCAEALEDLSRSAERDALTDLPKRDIMLDRLTQAIGDARRRGGHLAVLFIDLNNFKVINDTLGHGVGDQVLQQAAQRMGSVIRKQDTLSRYGGDEFLILITDIEQATDASEVARKLTVAIGMPFRIGEHVLRLSASVGICVYPEDGDTRELLIERADKAMYRAKRLGAGSYVFHDDPVGDIAPIASITHPVSRFDAAVADHERRTLQLREANGGLLIAALNAQELQAAAERAQQQQREFLALVAHELRNPLAPLLVAASLLRGSNEMDLESMRKIIEEQVALMNRMVGDLLDLSRSSTGKLRLEFRRIELRKIIDEAIEASRPAMDIRLQQIDVQLPVQPISMQGDPVRLAQILINLLDNASKYTPEGGQIQLSASVDDACVVIEVIDNGIGISADALARVFEPFAQDLHATAFNGQGLGLGLSVVKQLTEGHRGTVVVSSAGIGLGTRFTLTLPLKQEVGQTPALTRSN